MQVLGIPSTVDSEAVARAYKAKLREAGKDDAKKQRIESAHSSIMMASLTSRLQVAPSTHSSFTSLERSRCSSDALPGTDV